MKTEEEVWKDIKNFEGHYQVSNLGNVKSLSRVVLMKGVYPYMTKEKKLKPYLTGRGYYSVKLYKEKKISIQVHQLVAIAFLNHVIDGHISVINHKDLNKTNNIVSNLEIITNRDNCNKKHIYSASKHIGVYKKRNKYYSVIRVGHNKIYLGSFLSELEASEAYNTAVIKYVKKKYKVEVWFRYSGGNEKDSEIHEVEAENEPQAKRIALKNYDNRSVIPFKTEVL